jgi:Zn-finger nucleic acid-binding protein
MLCPTCQVELKMADRQGVEIDYCPQCRGVWLERGELDKIIDRSLALTPDRAPARPYPPSRGQSSYQPYDDDDDDWRRRDLRARRGWLGDLFDLD